MSPFNKSMLTFGFTGDTNAVLVCGYLVFVVSTPTLLLFNLRHLIAFLCDIWTHLFLPKNLM